MNRLTLLERIAWLFVLVWIGCVLGSRAPTFLGWVAGSSLAVLLVLKVIGRQVRGRRIIAAALLVFSVLATGLAWRTHARYSTTTIMELAVEELANAEYAEDPAERSDEFGKYNGRKLTLIEKGGSLFDFILLPEHGHIAKIVLRDVDVSLLTPSQPVWTRGDAGLTRIALTDRQWNRQQVCFEKDSPGVEVTGGDGFEVANLYRVDLAKNCLNAGLWEVLLFFKERDSKALYYHCWFTFPLGHYKRVFEANTGLSYLKHWYYLEHWFDPAGTRIDLGKLRSVIEERTAEARFDQTERVIVSGEQLNKRRTVLAENLVTWNDFLEGSRIQFASFVPPGRYDVSHPWENEYWRIEELRIAVARRVRSPASDKLLGEIELRFASRQGREANFIVSGIDLESLPRLPVVEYYRGLYMPMGIGVPPFFQSYSELERTPPDRSPYFCLLLGPSGDWMDHHKVGIDGPVIHRDQEDPDLCHIYLLSYERHSLIRHFVLRL